MDERAEGKRDSDPKNDTASDFAEKVERIHAMPKEVGALLVIIGLGGIMLPGPVGTPFLIMGGVVLWPKMFQRAESFMERRFPAAHRQAVHQAERFLNDLERRYPKPQ